ncbi:2400_t:CDS:2 [Scutellospora calospora]|uniref:2400_t:CDS:1 n=1 Tax=Scutellospora calospora TaxID=85575 RepID=A0ACA9JVN1_9GLOM|nr:2400_t:CDS:2 [Scutellospora calospora]
MTDSNLYTTASPPDKAINPFDAIVQARPVAYAGNDPTTEFFYRPRTLTVLAAMLFGLVYVAMYPEADDTATNIKFGTWAGISSFLLFAMLQFRDGPFIRPHPAFWRVVLGLGVLYQMFLVFLLFQNQLDIFVIYHIVGWYAKAVVLRDYWFCWILSVMFEWILDVLICNWAGLYFGMKTCEYFQMKNYSWRGIKQISSLKGKVKRTVQQFTPREWTSFEWGTTKSFKNYIAVIGLLFAFLQVELNSFYLKYLLWIPPDNPINTYRATLLFMCSIPATREAYQYLTDKECKRFGPQAWLTIATIMTESVICFKLGRGEFPNPVPTYVVIFWIILVNLLIGYAIWQFGIPYLKERMESSTKEQTEISESPSDERLLKDKKM